MDTSPRAASQAQPQIDEFVEHAREEDRAAPRWRVDPAGELHVFDPGHLWSACRLTCASLTSEVSEETRPRSICPRCAARSPHPAARAVVLESGREGVGR